MNSGSPDKKEMRARDRALVEVDPADRAAYRTALQNAWRSLFNKTDFHIDASQRRGIMAVEKVVRRKLRPKRSRKHHADTA